MEHGLKQRLIGATVLVSLAVIFIPMLIGEDSERSQEIQLDIPKFPKHTESKILPLPEKKPEQLVTLDLNAAKKSAVPLALPPAETTQKRVEGLQAWVVQVGSFSSRDNAEKFAKILQGDGHEAFVDEARVENKNTYKVLVGPEASRDKADQLSVTLTKHPQVNSTWVTRYP